MSPARVAARAFGRTGSDPAGYIDGYNLYA